MPVETNEQTPRDHPQIKESFLAGSERFKTSKATLWTDRFMTRFIKLGGLSIIVTILAIFLFILWQILPLFQEARVEKIATVPFQPGTYPILGMDEWGELPFVVDSKGVVHFVDLESGETTNSVSPSFVEPKKITTISYNKEAQTLLYGTADGYFAFVHVAYQPVYSSETLQREIKASLESGPFYRIGQLAYPVINLSHGTRDEHTLVAAIQEVEGRREVHTVLLVKERSLLGEGEISVEQSHDITANVKGTPLKVLVSPQADGVVVLTGENKVYYFYQGADDIELRQVFMPFQNAADFRVSSMNYLLGGTSLVFTNPRGDNRIFSLYLREGQSERRFGLTKEFSPLAGPATFYDRSLRNKGFLIGTGSHASLRYATTKKIRWQEDLPFEVAQAVLGRKYNRILFLDRKGFFHLYRLDDPHPEAGWQAFFGKIWYEGYGRADYVWQSTGGTDDFEIKLSLVPLILGTLKGTFYALLFALPIALLGAIYTSQFAHPRVKGLVKPGMEIMASLPSVVLGFLAALWLAPLIEARIPSVLLTLVFLPAFSFFFGWLGTHLPISYRRWIPQGYEWLFLLPLVLAACYAGWILGPVLERTLFVVEDAVTGEKVADFRLWWTHATGARFEQRNALVVGFMMGFAVIPIIFTIAEDSLSNVPRSLISASMALGASRWQTVWQVVIPTASPGIFSACMIGLGRAVGETMIVLMATGNTPVMDFNIFSGMRTLSANIAVELPEAPHHGTLYRTLFLGGLVLFLMTFFVNTLAEILRQYLREKYETV